MSSLPYDAPEPPEPRTPVSLQISNVDSMQDTFDSSTELTNQPLPSVENETYSGTEVIDLTGDDDDIPMTGTTTGEPQSLKVKVEVRDDQSSKPSLGEEIPELTQEANLDWQEDEAANAREAAELVARYGSAGQDPVVDTVQDNEEQMEDVHQQNIFDTELEDAEASAAFSEFKEAYDQKKRRNQTTLAEDIEFSKAYIAEQDRRRLRDRKRAFANAAQPDDTSLFFSDHQSSPPIDLTDLPPDDTELAPVDGLKEKRKGTLRTSAQRKESSEKGSKGKAKKVVKTQTKPKTSRANGENVANLHNLSSLFNHDVVAEAQANQALETAPAFQSRVRKDALKELLQSIPADQRDLHNNDRKLIDNAIKEFTRPVRSDGKGGWTLKGLNSSLKSYQIEGVGFMRRRENGKSKPRGGMLSHEMGFGKTIMAIANILDGRPSPEARNKTTLIVTPPSLTSQWIQEISLHAGNSLGQVMVYRSGKGVLSNDPVKLLSNMDVVITSYGEVLKSMPKNEPPAHLVTKQAKDEWWRAYFEKEKGLLHQIKFHRLILEEAQAIKNYQSKTSEAVCQLQGKFRWAISGTPVQNSIDEFFPYFRFLRVEDTGDITLFKRNFCKRGSAVAQQRLALFLSKIMCRRTHSSTLFGKPILRLPSITTETISVEFNEVEKTIYRIVRHRFVNKIRAYGKKDALEKNYQHVFVLLLRLRQLVGHIMLIQKTLKELLETEDLERLWRLTEAEGAPAQTDGSREVILSLRRALENVRPEDRENRSASDSNHNDLTISSTAEDTRAADVYNSGKIMANFRKYLESLRSDGQWERINRRCMCHYCRNPPSTPYITSCMHVYCLACINIMKEDAALKNQDTAKCVECSIYYNSAEPCTGFEEAANLRGTPASVRSGIRRGKADTEEEDVDWFTIGGPILQSAKSKAATEQIKAWLQEDPSSKVIVFTQFRGIIKILGRVCQQEDWGYVAYHGEMTFEARDAAINDFTYNPETKVLLAAMKAGGVGLNLCAANRCIIVDLYWNASVEQQALCRMFRIGQTREVKVVRFTVKDSIDDDLLKMQQRKTGEIEPVMAQSFRPGNLSTADLLALFGPLARDEGGEVIASGEDEPFIFPSDPYQIHEVESDEEPGGLII